MTDIVPIESSGGAGSDEPSSAVFHQRFSVDFDYDVHFTRDVFAPGNDLFLRVLSRRASERGARGRKGESRRHRVFVCIDSGVADAHPRLVRRIKDYCHAHQKVVDLVATPEIVPGGESVKGNWQVVQDLMVSLGGHRMDRQSYVVAIGGGSVLDMVGFVAALVHRGLRLVRMPTTVLAQNDAGVGVKNGMNEHGVKNFIGCFAPPFAVINDFSFLSTLSDEHWRGGVAEAFKVAIIKDSDFFEFLCESAAAIGRREPGPLEESIRRCAILHLEHIAQNGDAFELGTARPLDFGHWSAHKLEVLSDFAISHGAAVAAGIALDSYYAMKKELISRIDFQRILSGLTSCGFDVWYPEMSRRDASGDLALLVGLEEFREHLGGRLTITLPRTLGARCEVHHVNVDIVEEGIFYLRSYAAGRKKIG